MKRLLVALVVLGLMVFSSLAFAVDVRVSGEFYAAGLYLDKTTLKKDTATDGPSTAFYYQRLRLRADFIVTRDVIVTTRADIMERAWGAARSAPGTALASASAATPAENENIAFDLAYLSYISPYGIFRTGYRPTRQWGTVFADASLPNGKISYTVIKNGFTSGIEVVKVAENSFTAINSTASAADRDNDTYNIFTYYSWKGGAAGILYQMLRFANNRDQIPGVAGFVTQFNAFSPFVTAKLGPVTLNAELMYGFGQAQRWEGAAPLGTKDDTRAEQLNAYIDAKVDFGMVYVGGTFAYVAGDDPGTGTLENGFQNGGSDWNPCLILFNYDLNYWAGSQAGYNNSANANPMNNALFFQARGGLRPMDRLEIMAAVSFANADKKPTAAWLYNDYGWEGDLTATYKITDNLSYMLGGGYLFTGKYFKGTNDANNIGNDFIVINKLTLTF